MTAVQHSAADRDRATVEPLDTRSLLQRCPAWVLVAASIAVLAGSAVTAIGLELKAVVDQFREQVQNLE